MTKLIIALLLIATAICGQQTTATQPAQPNFAYSMADVLTKGATIGSHQFDSNAHLVGFPALSESGEVAFTVEFANGRKGIFTSAGRAVVEDGEDIGGGITVLQVASARPGDAQIANGSVSYLATFKGRSCATAGCHGLFTEKTLIAVQGSGAGTYTLGEDGKITSPAGNAWLAPTNISGTAGDSSMNRKLGLFHSLLCTAAPVFVTPNTTLPVGVKIPPQVWNPCTMSAAHPSQPAAPQGPPLPKIEITPTPAYCNAPAGTSFPLPWSSVASAAGPIGTFRTEAIPWGQSYKSALHPAITGNWMRKLFFATDCRPLLVSLSANPGPALELFTPAGLLATFSAEKGLYDFGGGIPNVTLPPASSPIENAILINRRCQALVSVHYRTSAGEQIGMAFGTPKSGCAQ